MNRLVEQLLEWDSIFVDPRLQFSVNRFRSARDCARLADLALKMAHSADFNYEVRQNAVFLVKKL